MNEIFGKRLALSTAKKDRISFMVDILACAKPKNRKN